jgi:hypothetical protein
MLIDNYSSCAYIDGSGGTHDVDLEDLELPKSELLCKHTYDDRAHFNFYGNPLLWNMTFF